MMNTNHVNGLPVVSIGTGERLGSVSEILLDPAADHVTAFAIAAGGGGLLPARPRRRAGFRRSMSTRLGRTP